MMTWQRGHDIVTVHRTQSEGTLADFISDLSTRAVHRVPGTAVYPHLAEGTVPLALRVNVEHNHVLHNRVVIVSAQTADVPHIPWEQRLDVDHLGDPGDGIVHIAVRFGFQDRSDIPEALRRADTQYLQDAIDLASATYFLSRIALRRTREPGMSTWRKQLFVALAHNTSSQAEHLCLPAERTVIIGTQIDI